MSTEEITELMRHINKVTSVMVELFNYNYSRPYVKTVLILDELHDELASILQLRTLNNKL